MERSMEVVQMKVAPERAEALVALRGEAIEAVRRECPGMISATLARLDEGRWIDVVVWESRERALAAAERVMAIPAFARWCENIAEVLSMEHASVRGVTDA